ncbi:AbrB/MazE/SpoVT family DNA-binding domain-containing protein [Liquorilactobacillus uvarum]|nr:AbrB/MazE/SpoVT family DNA-binding domain-containing protein [Liquorilactobacillus uvarum]
MNQSKPKIVLPIQVVEKLNLKKGDKVEVAFSDKAAKQVVVQPLNQAANRRSVSILRFFMPSVLSTIVFFIYFFYQREYQISLAGNESIASLTIILGLLSGSLSFAFFYLKDRKHIQGWFGKKLYWRSFLTILLSFTTILAISLLCFFWLIEILFKGSSFDLFTSTYMFLLFSNVINYLMIYAAINISSSVIFKILILVIVGGALAAMITNSNKRWWEHNISFLGTDQASNSWQFNLTLVVSALLLLALVDFIFASLKEQFHNNRRLAALKSLLILFSVFLAGVGVFANNGTGLSHKLHTNSATLLVYLLIITISSIHFLLPSITKEFKIISYTIGGGLLIDSILFQPIGYFSLTAFELIAFILAFSWILLLLQILQEMTQIEKNVFEITIQ